MAVTSAGAKAVDVFSFFPEPIGKALRAAVGSVGTAIGATGGQSGYSDGSFGKAKVASLGGGVRAGAARFASTPAAAKATIAGKDIGKRVLDMLVKVAQKDPALAAQAARHLVQVAEANSPRVGGVWQNSDNA